MSERRAVLLDVDGTLLTSALELTPAVAAAVRDVAAAGVEVVLASGRPAQSLQHTAKELQVVDYGIASNGGAVVEFLSWRALHASTMPAAVASAIEAKASGHAIRTCSYAPLSWSVAEVDSWVELEMSRSGTNPRVRSTLDADGEGPIKLLLIGPPPVLIEFQTTHLAPLASEIESFFTYPEYLEVMPREHPRPWRQVYCCGCLMWTRQMS